MGMMVMTDTAINAAKAKAKAEKRRKDYGDAAATGLRLRIGKTGAAAWSLSCRDAMGRARLFAIGDYPAIGISAAREAIRGLREQVRLGLDPIADKRRSKALGAAGEVSTLLHLLDAYGAARAAPPSWTHSQKRVRRVFAGLLALPLSKIRVADLRIAMDVFPRGPSAIHAGNALRPALKWGFERGYVPQELTGLKTGQTAKRDRVLSAVELAAILPPLIASESMYAKCMRFILWTYCRKGEAENATWDSVDLETGVWVAKKTKNGKWLVLTLPRQAIEFLQQHKPANAKPEHLIFGNAAGMNKPIANWDRFQKVLMKKCGVYGWHRHDLRGTGATVLFQLFGYDISISKAALNHTVIHDGAIGSYVYARPDEKVMIALQRYADWLDELTASDGAPG